jgi:Holliday junction resolvase RusA-like endonuclease
LQAIGYLQKGKVAANRTDEKKMKKKKVIEIAEEPPRSTAQMKKVSVIHGRPHFYEPENVRRAKTWLRNHLADHAPEKPYEGAVELQVEWTYHSNKKKTEWKITRPDTDNLIKMLKDVMTELGYWKDDAQVCLETSSKCISKNPGLKICIREMEAYEQEVHRIAD